MVKNKKKKTKTRSLRVILFKKAIKDLLLGYKQFIAMILIAALAFTLYFGLAANHHALSESVSGSNGIYSRTNMADLFLTTSKLDDTDIKNIVNDKLNPDKLRDEIIEYDKRFMFQSNIASEIPDSDVSTQKVSPLERGSINGKYTIILNDNPINEEKINKASKVYEIKDGKRVDIKKPVDGIFLSQDYVNKLDIGTDIKISFSIKNLLKMLKVTYNIEDGSILYNSQVIIDSKKIKQLDQFDSLLYGAGGYLQTGKDNIINLQNYKNILRLIDSDKINLNLVTKFAGFIEQPEVIEKKPNGGTAFMSFDYFFNSVLTSLKSETNKNIQFFSVLNYLYDMIAGPKSNTDIIRNLIDVDYKKELSKIYTQKFFDHQQTIFKSNIVAEDQTQFIQGITLLNQSLPKLQEDKIYNQLIFVTKDENSTKKLQSDINDYYHKLKENDKNTDKLLIFNLKRSKLQSNLVVENDVVQSKQLTYAFPLVFFVVAVLVIVTTASQIIIRERSSIGTLKALGISNTYIYLYYIFINLFITFLGFLIGVIVGPLLIPYVISVKYSYVYNLISINYFFPYIEALVSLLIVILLIGTITYLVCRKEIILLPAQSMRPKPPRINVKMKKLSKSKSIASKMAFRNIKINWVRSILTIFGVLGCSSLLIGGLGITDTIKNGIKYDMHRFYNKADVAVSFINQSEDARADILAIDGVKKMESFYNGTINIEYKDTKYSDINLYIFSDESHFYDPLPVDKTKQGEVLISNKMAEKYNLEVGNNITLDIDGQLHTLKIGNKSPTFFVDGIIAKSSDLQYFKTRTNNAYLELDKTLDDTKIEKITQAIEKLGGVTFVITTKQTLILIDSVISTLSTISATISMFAVLLALIVLYNQARLNLTERTREIVALKVQGFTRLEIIKSLIIEMMFLTGIGALIGLGLGYPMLYMVLETNKVEMVNYIYHINPTTFIASFLITIVVSFLINLFMGYKTDKIDMIKNMKLVE